MLISMIFDQKIRAVKKKTFPWGDSLRKAFKLKKL